MSQIIVACVIKIWIHQNAIAYVITNTYNYGETWDWVQWTRILLVEGSQTFTLFFHLCSSFPFFFLFHSPFSPFLLFLLFWFILLLLLLHYSCFIVFFILVCVFIVAMLADDLHGEVPWHTSKLQDKAP